MLQQSGTLCIALLRVAQWPNLSRCGPWIPQRLGGAQKLGKTCTHPSLNFSSSVKEAKNMEKEPADQEMPKNDSVPNDVTVPKHVTVDQIAAINDQENFDKVLKPVQNHESSTGIPDINLELIEQKDAKTTSRNFQDQKLMSAPKLAMRSKAFHTLLPKLQGLEEAGQELSAVMRVNTLSRALDLSQSFNSKQRISVMKTLAENGQRPLPLIQSLTEGIVKDCDKLSVKDLSDLLFSMSKLNYVNDEVLTSVCNALKDRLGSVTRPAVIGSTIKSLRKLNFRDTGLLEEISIWMENNYNAFHNPSSFVYTLALQNYLPSNHATLFAMLWRNFSNEIKDQNDVISLIWSFVVLRVASEEHFLYVLNSAFVNALKPEMLWETSIKQLLNINATAEILTKYKGPRLPKSLLQSITFPVTAEKQFLITRICDSLFGNMDTSLYATSFPTKFGFSIDLLCNLGKDCAPHPLHVSSADTSRVAIIALTYNDCCKPDHSPCGFKELEERILLKQGFKVIQFPFYVFSPDKPSNYCHQFFQEALEKVFKNK